jgi:hypothetical protein
MRGRFGFREIGDLALDNRRIAVENKFSLSFPGEGRGHLERVARRIRQSAAFHLSSSHLTSRPDAAAAALGFSQFVYIVAA